MHDRWQTTRRAALRWTGCGMLVLALAGLAGCGQTNGRSPSYLVIDLLEAAPGGATSPTYSTTLQSDVETKGGIYEDAGQVTLHIALRDVTSTTGPSTTNWITVTRYRVAFRRSDGRNTQGVDVPYTFDGAASGTFDATGGALTFVMVRAQAKFEAPLAGLRGLGGALVISTLADVTFYGQDQNGNTVSVTGTISVNFADWADPA